MTNEERLDIAFNNSYRVIILDYDWGEIMTNQSQPFFAHNPAKLIPKKEDIEIMIEYFIEQEEYIKCKSLKEYIERMEM